MATWPGLNCTFIPGRQCIRSVLTHMCFIYRKTGICQFLVTETISGIQWVLHFSPRFGLAVLLLAWWTTGFCWVTLTRLCGLSPRFLLLASTLLFYHWLVQWLSYLAWVLTPQPYITRQEHWLSTVSASKEWFHLPLNPNNNKASIWRTQTDFRNSHFLQNFPPFHNTTNTKEHSKPRSWPNVFKNTMWMLPCCWIAVSSGS